MKRKRYRNSNNQNVDKSVNKKTKPTQIPLANNNRTTEILKLALERVCALQAELMHATTNNDDDEQQVDPETAGYAACAIETFRFLESEGLTSDHPIIQRLSEHLLGDNSTESKLSKNV